MKFILYIILLGIFVSCDDMDAKFKHYLEEGERVYIAKSDSVHMYSGLERFQIEFWLSDPRASRLTVNSLFLDEPFIIPIEKDRDFSVPILVTIPAAEGSLTLNLITSDDYGNTSIPDEQFVSVYGQEYISTLNQKYIKSAKYTQEKGAVITWGSISSAKEIGVRLFYSNTVGNEMVVFKSIKELEEPTELADIDPSQSLSYETLFLPEVNCIDTLMTAKTEIELQLPDE